MQETCGILSHHFDRIGSVWLVGAARSAVIRRYDPVVLREPADEITPFRDVGSKPTDQHQGLALAVYLVIHLDIVYRFRLHRAQFQQIGLSLWHSQRLAARLASPAAGSQGPAQLPRRRLQTGPPRDGLDIVQLHFGPVADGQQHLDGGMPSLVRAPLYAPPAPP